MDFDVVPVFVADWEMECCGRPFSMGTKVRWHLQFLYEDEMSAPPEALLPVDSPVSRAVAAAARDTKPDHVATPRGALFATWHGIWDTPSRPPVPGIVRRIRLVRQSTLREGRHVTVLPEGARLTELTSSRGHFSTGLMRTPEETWAETGLLVDLSMHVEDLITYITG